jgi:hypothetical protein
VERGRKAGRERKKGRAKGGSEEARWQNSSLPHPPLTRNTPTGGSRTAQMYLMIRLVFTMAKIGGGRRRKEGAERV